MMKTLFLKDGKVVGHATAYDPSVTMASTIPGAVPYVVDDLNPADTGWDVITADGVTTFEPPAPTLRTRVSPVEFKLSFTSAERLAIKVARYPAEGASLQEQQIGAVIDDWFDILDDQRLTEIRLDSPSTIDGVNFLASIGLITTERAAEILAGVEG